MLDSTLFLVRVWRRITGGEALFRASVRAADSERAELFTHPEDLARYLDRASLDERAEAKVNGESDGSHEPR